MDISRKWSYVLLAVAVLLEFGSSQTSEGRIKAMKVTVSITNCDPSRDPIKLKTGGTVEWKAVDADYKITFEPKVNPHTSVPIPVPAPLPLPKGVKTPQVLSLPTDCTSKGCYFKYDISTGDAVCNDPGIRIEQ